MSIQFVTGKLKGEERKAIIQEVQRQMQEAALGAIKPLLTEFCEEELTVKLGRGKGEPRRVGGQAREIEWPCGKCGYRDANHFTRDGHYRRSLETGWGHIEGLRVPMVECQCCGHDVVCTYTILEKYRRFWLDMDQQVLFGSGLCQSLRQLSQQWSAVLGSSVSLRTINERINQIEPLRKLAHREPISDVPAVVQFDGIWLRLQTQTETVKVDKRQRKRQGTMPALNIALLVQEAAVGRNLSSRPLKGAPCHVHPNLPTRIREVRDRPVIQRIMAIGQLFELIHTSESKVSRKHGMISF
jgi:hypothetical protein